MKSLTPTGKKHALMVSGAGIPEDLMNQVLGQHGFAPVSVVATLADLTTRMRLMPPSLVIVPVTGARNGGEFLHFEQELRRNSQVAAIGTAAEKDADMVLAAMRAGVLEFLVTPTDTEELRVAVGRLLSLSNSAPSQGKIFTVFSAKGGLGTSTIAASLSWEFAQRNGGAAAALADFTTTGAGVRVMLNLNPMYDLGNIAMRADRIDREILKSVLVPHPDGVSVLAAAEEVDGADPLDAQTAGRLFDAMRDAYLFTVVDTDHHFADQTLAALDAADKILVVTQLDVSALRSTQRTLGVFSRLGYATDKLVIIANRRSDRDRISIGDAEKVLRRSVDFKLPNDYAACADAITNGQFVQRYAPSSPFSAGIASMVTAIGGSFAGRADQSNDRADRSRLSRFFGRR